MTDEPCHPWPRQVLPPDDWCALAATPGQQLLALWADTAKAHALFTDPVQAEVLFVSVPIEAGRYPALSPWQPGAAWFERAVFDLWGGAAEGGTDGRPWLDHGRWPQRRPLALRSEPSGSAPEPPEFLPVDGEDLHQLAIGPVHGGFGQPAHLRVTAAGETVVRLEVRLGYAHRGTLALFRGKSTRAAARFAARLAGETTVAHSIAFARAAEAALATVAPPRADALRAVMAELERIIVHLHDIALVCDEAGMSVASTRCGWHREMLHRAAQVAFGHRLMMDNVVPGGIATDLAPGGPEAIRRCLYELNSEFAALAGLCTEGDALRGIGVIDPALLGLFACGGVVARASGSPADARRFPGYPPYPVPGPLSAMRGDAAARQHCRLAEIAGSLRLLQALLDDLPAGGIQTVLPMASGEGVGVAEGPRGDIWYWLRLDHGQIASVFPRDPGWAHWPLLEAVAVGNPVAELPLIAASLGLACSAVDL